MSLWPMPKSGLPKWSGMECSAEMTGSATGVVRCLGESSRVALLSVDFVHCGARDKQREGRCARVRPRRHVGKESSSKRTASRWEGPRVPARAQRVTAEHESLLWVGRAAGLLWAATLKTPDGTRTARTIELRDSEALPSWGLRTASETVHEVQELAQAGSAANGNGTGTCGTKPKRLWKRSPRTHKTDGSLTRLDVSRQHRPEKVTTRHGHHTGVSGLESRHQGTA